MHLPFAAIHPILSVLHRRRVRAALHTHSVENSRLTTLTPVTWASLVRNTVKGRVATEPEKGKVKDRTKETEMVGATLTLTIMIRTDTRPASLPQAHHPQRRRIPAPRRPRRGHASLGSHLGVPLRPPPRIIIPRTPPGPRTAHTIPSLVTPVLVLTGAIIHMTTTPLSTRSSTRSISGIQIRRTRKKLDSVKKARLKS